MKAGLVQMSLKGKTEWSPDRIRDAMLEAHGRIVRNAAEQGVEVLAFQELFNQPYFCAISDSKWSSAAERVPDGPSVSYFCELAKKYAMVIVAPISEIDDGKIYNTAAVIDADGKFIGKYRKNHIPTTPGVGDEAFYFLPSDLGYPVFQTAYCRLGIYICHDRHFPEGWRILALNGAQYVVNPSATIEGISRHSWRIAQPAAAVANGYFVGTCNRVGTEAPWDVGEYYGSSYFVDPLGQIIAEAGSSEDELLVADLNLQMIDDVRKKWPFLKTRRPGSYGELVRETNGSHRGSVTPETST